MANIAIFGGTKFFGAILAEKLWEDGHNNILISRAKSLPLSLVNKVTHIRTALISENEADKKKTINFMSNLCLNEEIDIIIDNISWLQNEVETICKCIKASGEKLKQYILCSSVAVYNDWNKGYSQQLWHTQALK